MDSLKYTIGNKDMVFIQFDICFIVEEQGKRVIKTFSVEDSHTKEVSRWTRNTKFIFSTC